MKDQTEILNKLNIEALNPMQEEAIKVIGVSNDVILLSPTGTGKTLAFLLPIIAGLIQEEDRVQVLILAPSRELAVQIEQVLREMGTGFKTNVLYGGRPLGKDRLDLQHPPAILIGTPGRIADHLKKKSFDATGIHTLILDEFDKSLETGFHDEMKVIADALPAVKKRILTSATQKVEIPGFLRLRKAVTINYLKETVKGLSIKTVKSNENDKLPALLLLLKHLKNKPGIIFCNFRESIEEVGDFLEHKGIDHSCFYGLMEQQDRERALVKFRNGTHRILLATDLAARGIDVPEIQFIIHFELPPKADEFLHRNGRTARMNSEGTAYILQGRNEKLPDFIEELNMETVPASTFTANTNSKDINWKTLYISGGRRDKISKGDIAGLFMKQGGLALHQLGLIEVKQDFSFVAVEAGCVNKLLPQVTNAKLKTKKVRVTELM